jgi:Domain of unknown function (DUF4439)
MRASSTPAAGPARAEQEIAALQAALAAEQAAIYGYGVVGAHLAGARRVSATADWTAHQVAADRLTAQLRARGATPAAAAAAYRLPHQVGTAVQAAALAVTLEDQVTSAYLGLVALAAQSLRMLGAREVRAAALRAAAWRGRSVAFPGLSASALAGHPSAAASPGRRGRGLSG